jgi:hypothetical protein
MKKPDRALRRQCSSAGSIITAVKIQLTPRHSGLALAHKLMLSLKEMCTAFITHAYFLIIHANSMWAPAMGVHGTTREVLDKPIF